MFVNKYILMSVKAISQNKMLNNFLFFFNFLIFRFNNFEFLNTKLYLFAFNFEFYSEFLQNYRHMCTHK